MQQNNYENIYTLSKSSIFDEKSFGTSHTPFSTETMFFNLIKNGEDEKISSTADRLLSQKIVAGKLSDDEITQAKYLAVCTITLGTRYAVLGGLSENEAYKFSDETIYTIDKMKTKQEILSNIKERLVLLAFLVKKEQSKKYPIGVKKAIDFINKNLHEKLSVEILANECSLSPDYLSAIFKKNVGISISSYILQKRLDSGLELLLNGNKVSDIAYYLNFCSESYFIKCFKERFGATPKKYLSLH